MQRRSYNEFCGIAKALDIVGERWTLLIVRNLLLGPQRYSELLRGLPGITTNLLAKRLHEMEEGGLLEQVRGTAGDTSHAYRLTSLGLELEPTIHALGRWGWRYLGQPTKKEHRSFEWLLVALKRDYRGGSDLRVELVADGVPYSLQLQRGGADVARGTLRDPDLRIRGGGAQIARLFLEPKAAPARDVTVEGSAKALRTLIGSFAFPPRGVE
ncbi:MAG: helix-turn-helix domain-containing protein [Gemmatimonadota bacterium]